MQTLMKALILASTLLAGSVAATGLAMAGWTAPIIGATPIASRTPRPFPPSLSAGKAEFRLSIAKWRAVP